MKQRIEKCLSYEKTKNIWRKDYQSTEFKECSLLNFELFGEKLQQMPRCECVELFFFQLKMHIKRNPKMEKENKIFVVNGILTNHNLATPLSKFSSDEEVITFLRKMKEKGFDIEKFRKFFSVMPANLDEILKVKVAKPLEEMKFKELQAYAQEKNIEIDGNSKDVILAQILEAEKELNEKQDEESDLENVENSEITE